MMIGLKYKIWLKAIAIILIQTFISLDISCAVSNDLRNLNSHLAPPLTIENIKPFSDLWSDEQTPTNPTSQLPVRYKKTDYRFTQGIINIIKNYFWEVLLTVVLAGLDVITKQIVMNQVSSVYEILKNFNITHLLYSQRIDYLGGIFVFLAAVVVLLVTVLIKNYEPGKKLNLGSSFFLAGALGTFVGWYLQGGVMLWMPMEMLPNLATIYLCFAEIIFLFKLVSYVKPRGKIPFLPSAQAMVSIIGILSSCFFFCISSSGTINAFPAAPRTSAADTRVVHILQDAESGLRNGEFTKTLAILNELRPSETELMIVQIVETIFRDGNTSIRLLDKKHLYVERRFTGYRDVAYGIVDVYYHNGNLVNVRFYGVHKKECLEVRFANGRPKTARIINVTSYGKIDGDSKLIYTYDKDRGDTCVNGIPTGNKPPEIVPPLNLLKTVEVFEADTLTYRELYDKTGNLRALVNLITKAGFIIKDNGEKVYFSYNENGQVRYINATKISPTPMTTGNKVTPPINPFILGIFPLAIEQAI
ncbi:MAG: hypothetical protein ABH952_07610 [Candidatus Omnitrophota bacterium]